MKKILISVLVIALFFVFACASDGSAKPKEEKAPAAAASTTGGPVDLGKFTLRMEDTFEYGNTYNGHLQRPNLWGGKKIVAGGAYTLKVTYTPSRDMEEKMQVMFVDTSAAGGWWTELTTNNENTQSPAVKAGEVATATYTFETINDASSSAPDANTIVFMTEGEGVRRQGGGTKKPFNIVFSEFVLTKTN